MPLDVQKAARKVSSMVQSYCSDVEYIAEEDFLERKAKFEKMLHAEIAKAQKAEADATEDSKSKCYRGLGGGAYEVAKLSSGGDDQCDSAPMKTSSSARAQALRAEEVASRCQEDPEALFLCDFGIGDTDIEALTAGLKRAGHNLTMLDISSNQIADAGIQKLVTAFAGGMCPKLTELFIGCNAFGEQGRTMLDGGLRVLRKGLTIHAEDSVGKRPEEQPSPPSAPQASGGYAVSKRPAQELSVPAELSEPANTKQETAVTEQEARPCDIESPASRKQKSPTGGDTGGPLGCESAAAPPKQSRAEDFIPSATYTGGKKGYVFKKGDRGLGYYPDACSTPGNAFTGSATIVQGTEGQEVHVVLPLAGTSITSAADLDLDISAKEVRVGGPGGLSVSVALPTEVEPGSAHASFSKKRQQMVVKLKAC